MSKKEQILNTSLELFNNQGIHSTPTAQIAKEAGVGTGTVFHHFSTKKNLIEELYSKCVESQIELIRPGHEVDLSVEGKIKHWLFASLEWGVHNPSRQRFIEQYATDFDLPNGEHEYLMTLIKEGVGTRRMRQSDHKLVMNVMLGIRKAILLQVTEDRQWPLSAKTKFEFFDLLWSAVGY